MHASILQCTMMSFARSAVKGTGGGRTVGMRFEIERKSVLSAEA